MPESPQTLWRQRATEEDMRIGWEMRVKMDRTVCAVPREAHERRVRRTRTRPRTGRRSRAGVVLAWVDRGGEDD